MKRCLMCLLVTTSIIAGCAAPTAFNISNTNVGSLKTNSAGTYSDYGSGIKFNDKDGLYHLNVYTGGLGSCDGGAVLYAKPKLDEFMNKNNFKSYTVIKGEYSPAPLSKCELLIQFSQ